MVTEPATPTVVSIKLPFPPAELSPNARIERHEKARHVAAYRKQCSIMALASRRDFERRLGVAFPLRNPVVVIVTFVLTTLARKHDWDNLVASFKAGLDGIRDAGFITDDSIQVIRRLGLEVERGDEPCVRVRIEGAS